MALRLRGSVYASFARRGCYDPAVSSSLRGRVAAITGASAGIGKACAERFAAEGMAVVLGARREDRLSRIAEAVRAAGGRALPVVTDVTREADARRLVDAAVETFGGLDVMVCNAGIGYYGTIEQTDEAIMRRLIDVNYLGTHFAARAAVPVFRRAGRGHLVIVSSIVGRRGIALMGGYCATKFAQVGLAESLRAEFVGTNIHVSVVYPVSTATEFLDTLKRDYGYTVEGRGPRQSADEVARAVVACLQSPRAEVYPHALSRGLAVLNALAPGALDKFVRRYGRRRVQK